MNVGDFLGGVVLGALATLVAVVWWGVSDQRRRSIAVYLESSERGIEVRGAVLGAPIRGCITHPRDAQMIAHIIARSEAPP